MLKFKTTVAACLALSAIGGIIACSSQMAKSRDGEAKTSANSSGVTTTVATVATTPAPSVNQIARADDASPAATPLVGGKKPNIVIIWGDDIGQSDVSAYSHGLMGFKTPNIDRLAHEGVMFTDFYGEQSCTAGRSSFITGQCGFRTGNTKVGLPGAAQGIQTRDVTIAQLLKAQGYSTAQFGKNHLGDRNEHLPTVHGFDEFYGALYHLNASEEPELPDYPKAADFPNFLAKFGPRGVLDCKATDVDDTTVDPRFGKVGMQTVKDTGPLTKKRMETVDDDFADRSVDFLKRQHAAGKPVFLWVNFTHMHFRTHTKPESIGQSGRWQSPYHDTMIDHDKNVGQVLKALDDLGMADDTIVMYSTDNGPHMNSWPDGAMTPFRNEKNSNWEGAYRVPCMIKWPGHIKPGTVENGIVSHLDLMPTLLAASRRSGRERAAPQGHESRRCDLQGASRRLRYAAASDRSGDGESAQGVLLLQRRRRSGRPALRQLEDGFC